MIESPIQEIGYASQITSQLEFARHSNLLVFSRDKQMQHLAKKLKPEFARVFFSVDLREAQKMLTTVTNDSLDSTINEHVDSVVTIDIVRPFRSIFLYFLTKEFFFR
jgi:hypothetical protein